MKSPAASIAKIVRDHGFAVQAVFPSEDSPPFAYTTGLALAGLPEMIIVGLPGRTAHELLNDMVKLVRDGTVPFDFSQKSRIDGVDDLVEGFPVSLRLLPDTPSLHDEWVVQTGQVPGRKDFQVVQIVWPDKHGFYPEDEGCSEAIAKAQNAIHDWSADPKAVPSP